jgi:hypothetical protein
LGPSTRKRKNLRRDPKAATAIVREGIHAIRISATNSHEAAISDAESAGVSLRIRINDAPSRTKAKAVGRNLTTKVLTGKIRYRHLKSWDRIPVKTLSKILSRKRSGDQLTSVHGIQTSATVALDQSRLKQLQMRQRLVSRQLQPQK